MKGLLFRLFLVFSGLCAAGSATATVYRCQHNGHVVYSDQVCGKHAKPLNFDDHRHPVSVVHPQVRARLASTHQGKHARRAKSRQKQCKYDSLEAFQRRNLRVSNKIVVCEPAAAVRATWGKPDTIRRTVSKGHVSERWTYNGPRRKPLRVVNLTDGRVTSFRK